MIFFFIILVYLPAPRSLPWDPRICGSFSGPPFRRAVFHLFLHPSAPSSQFHPLADPPTPSLGSLRAAGKNRGRRQGALASCCAEFEGPASRRGRPVAGRPAWKASQAPHAPCAARVTRTRRPAFRRGWGWYIMRGGRGRRSVLGVSIVRSRRPARSPR